MNQKELREAFRTNKKVYGTMISSPNPKFIGEISKLGLDFVFIDTEHIPLDRSMVSWMCQTFSAMNIAPIVRVPSPDPYEVSKALDGGACGILAPYLETVDQVQALRGAVKYRPLKGEKLKKVLYGEEKLSEREEEYLKAYNDNHIMLLNIESTYGIHNLDAMLSVPDVDGVFIGPHDLSVNMGVPEDYEDKEWNHAVSEIIKRCRAKNFGVGNHLSLGIENQLRWAKEGMNIVIWNADMIRVIQALRADFEYIREQLGDTAKTDRRETSI